MAKKGKGKKSAIRKFLLKSMIAVVTDKDVSDGQGSTVLMETPLCCKRSNIPVDCLSTKPGVRRYINHA